MSQEERLQKILDPGKLWTATGISRRQKDDSPCRCSTAQGKFRKKIFDHGQCRRRNAERANGGEQTVERPEMQNGNKGPNNETHGRVEPRIASNNTQDNEQYLTQYRQPQIFGGPICDPLYLRSYFSCQIYPERLLTKSAARIQDCTRLFRWNRNSSIHFWFCPITLPSKKFKLCNRRELISLCTFLNCDLFNIFLYRIFTFIH